MVAVTNAKHVFNEVPSGYPEPGKTTITDSSEKIDLDAVALEGGALIKVLALSIDPYMRGRMREEHIQSYVPAFKKGEPITNGGVGKVLRSENPKFKQGDYVYGTLNFVEYSVVKDLSQFRVLPTEPRIPWTAYTGAAGMPGQTAFVGWKEYSAAKKGDVVFVSGGAGPVGSFVIQLAKKEGLKVIASAGSEDKVDFIKKCGADVAFNYKTSSTEEILKKEGPIDIYWDNVGGETLEAALSNANKHARFIECGMISGYNEKGQGIRNMMLIVGKAIKMTGFLVFDLLPKYVNEFNETVPKEIAEGKLHYLEHVYRGLDASGQAIHDVQKGKNTGKAVILVAED